MSSLFGKSKSKDPKEQMNSWTSKLRSESRVLDRQIRSIQREQDRTVHMLKETVKKAGDNRNSCSVLAKEIVRSRKSIARLHSAKAEINSIIMAVKNQQSVGKLVGSVDKSTQIMRSLGKLNKMPEMMGIMREMSKEMLKNGIVEEMMEDTFENMDQSLGIDQDDEEVLKEIDGVLYEITQGQLGKANRAVQEEPIPTTSKPTSVSDKKVRVRELERETTQEDEENEDEVRDMRDRLHALRS
ncbi:unnamed protein product [Gordionus sp. m RMFG-2023]|uniref:charged multivesicular body protein 3-like n=1 Tax=Gordionus sp. m RMFG-2023 TaxID=3053472 RepID=UPI0030E50E40